MKIFFKKIMYYIVSIFILSIAVFYISRFAPGDPLISYYGERVEKMGPQEREWAEKKLGLDAPLSMQYIRWLEKAVHGDFGISYKYKRDVKEVVAGRIGNTLLLGGMGFLLIFALALALGVWCAWQEGKPADRIACRLGVVTGCIPEFWLALMLILIFSVQLKWLPSGGAYTVWQEGGLADRIRHLILPLTVVTISHVWYYAYMVRNRMLDELGADYVLMARAKGLKEGRVLLKHCLRNVLPSYFSMMAISVSHILGGTYVVEMVFSYPGLGTLAYESARYKDYNLLMLVCMLSGMLVMAGNMAAQAVNGRVDPRMRGERDA